MQDTHQKPKRSSDLDQGRKRTRLLSSLLDLKLVEVATKKEIVEDESRRKNQKCCLIKQHPIEDEIFQNFTIVEKKKSIVDKNLLIKSLSQHFTFSTLIKEKAMLELLLEKFKLCRINKDEYLMNQNDNGSSFFILHEGELAVEIDGKMKKKLQSGDGFGQLSLMYSAPRSASIKALKSSFLWYIDRSTFRKAISSLIEKNYDYTRKFIEKTAFFSYLTSSQKDKLASISIIQRFSPGQILCKEGELANSMYIVKSGVLSKVKDSATEKLKADDFFGDYTMLQKNCKWQETVTASEECQVIALGNDDVQGVLGKSLPLIVVRNKAKDSLNKAKEFTVLSSHYQDLALDCFKIRSTLENETISSASFIFLVLEGEYEISYETSNPIITTQYSKTSLFGSLIDPINIKVKFKTNGKIAWTTSKEIIDSFNGTYEEAVQKSRAIEKTENQHRDHISLLRAESEKYSINDFKVLSKLGEGQFGTVFLVTDPTKSRFYALKCISKYEAIKSKLEGHLINQKNVLEEMNYYTPFCVNFVRSYKDDRYVYFLMEFINGLELFDAIRVIGILDSNQTRFYGAIMVEFLEKIHSKNIIYRDLKPENAMVCEDGYLKMIDMGTCKKLESKEPNGNFFTQKTFTIIGTPNYMAPEIISGKGYSSAVDLWSLGVVLYEFMAGYVPFGQEAEDPYEIYQEILKKSLTFPPYMKDHSAISFITQLLNKLPDVRLGGSYNNLKRHNFLASIDWSALLQKKMKPFFQVPKKNLIDIDKLMSKAKSLSCVLPTNNTAAKPINRKDLNPKWDQIF